MSAGEEEWTRSETLFPHIPVGVVEHVEPDLRRANDDIGSCELPEPLLPLPIVDSLRTT